MPNGMSLWTSDDTVNGFARAQPNDVLVRFAAREAETRTAGTVVDIGCGAGRNAVPLTRAGWRVVGTDLSHPMLAAAVARVRRDAPCGRALFMHAPMETIPMADAQADLVVAHGIWNLACSGEEFRHALAEAARVAKPGAGLFVFTFSRNTLAPSAQPVPGEAFVFTQFAGRPQVFLTAAQLVTELASVGFDPDPAVPLTEYNRHAPGTISTGAPVIYEASFRRRN